MNMPHGEGLDRHIPIAEFLDRLERRAVEVSRPIAFIGVVGMLAISGITMLDVLARWLANAPVLGLNEIVAMLFAVTITSCLPYGISKDINLRLDLLETWIRGRLAAWVETVGALTVLLFFALLAWHVMGFADDVSQQKRTTVILGWRQGPFMWAVSVLLWICVLIQVVIAAKRLVNAILYRPSAGIRESSPTAWVVATGVVAVFMTLIGYGVFDFGTFEGLASKHTGLTIGIFCALMWVLLLMLVPVNAVMGLMGIVGTALFIGFPPAFSTLATEVTGFMTNSQVAVLPLFLMMGSFAAVAGMADDVYALAHALFSRFPGGLAMATIGGCAGFGAMTGSTVATAATVGRVALPEMRARGYSPALSSGCVAAGGTLGNLVPPGSGPLVLFALLTEASIGQLFIASVVPSLIVVAAYLATILLYVKLSPGAAPAAVTPRPGELRTALRRCGPIMTLFVVILGGLYTGVFTATEAAAVGAFGAFLAALLRGKLRRKQFWDVMGETTSTTALIYPLIFGALIFAFFTLVSGLTEHATKYIVSLGWEPLAVVALLLAAFVVLGTFMDSYAIMIITVPIVTPLVTGVGYDIIWWGVLMLFVVEIGGISPPFGLTMYVLKAIDNIPVATIFKGVTPFCIAALIVLAILTVFPGLTLWLPATMMG